MAEVRVPTWAEAFVPGRCGCGARLVKVECYCGGHVACSRSGVNVEHCTTPVAEPAPDGDPVCGPGSMCRDANHTDGDHHTPRCERLGRP